MPATITAGIIPKPRQSILILIDASLSPGLSRHTQLLNKLDLDLILASIEPGSQVFCEDATATLIYRTTKHRLDPLILSGEQTGDGRALGQVIDPVVPAGQPRPTFRQQAAGLGIPYSLAANLVSDDDPAWEHKFGQISVCAMALVALLLYSPDATRIADATWAVMADWIEADPNAPTGSRRSRVAEGYSRGSLFDPQEGDDAVLDALRFWGWVGLGRLWAGARGRAAASSAALSARRCRLGRILGICAGCVFLSEIRRNDGCGGRI